MDQWTKRDHVIAAWLDLFTFSITVGVLLLALGAAVVCNGSCVVTPG